MASPEPAANPLLAAALDYATVHHLAVFPCYEIVGGDCACPKDHRSRDAYGVCGSPGKHPRTAKGFQDATRDAVTIKRWWMRWPQAHIGVATGAMSGIVVVDIDPRNGGEEALHDLEDTHGKLPVTPHALTGGGGSHFIYLRPKAAHVASRPMARGVDIKADGGYVIAAPSGHLSGRQYTWELTQALGDTPLAELPAWISEKLHRDRHAYTPLTATPVTNGFVGAAFEAAGWLLRKVGEGRCAAQCPWESEHSGGSRGDSSTVIFAPPVGSVKGWFHCSHEHCRNRKQEDVFKAIPAAARQTALRRLELPDEYDPTVDDLRAPGPFDGPLPMGDWKAELQFAGNGRISRTPGNAALLLANLEQWAGSLEYDAFVAEARWVKECPPLKGLVAPKVGEPLQAHHVTYVQQWFARYKNVDFGQDPLWTALEGAARANTVHPVLRYLEGLEWDGVGRLGGWLSRYCGAPDHDLVHRIGIRWMVSAVARVKQPGCQVDHLLVLEGPQGVGKSQIVRTLGGAWYLGTLPAIHTKDAMQTLLGHWIVEIAELEALRGVSLTRVKDWITQPMDTYRPSYGRHLVRRPRQAVFIATTNETNYLHDATGNRRFWPIPVAKVDLAALEQDRDQLWAEAVRAFGEGVQWWPSEDETGLLAQLQASRVEEDPWEGPVLGYLDGKQIVSIPQLLSDLFNMEIGRTTRREQMRVAGILKRAGWTSTRSKTSRRWQRGPEQGGLW